MKAANFVETKKFTVWIRTPRGEFQVEVGEKSDAEYLERAVEVYERYDTIIAGVGNALRGMEAVGKEGA